jgi:hypothetical protein
MGFWVMLSAVAAMINLVAVLSWSGQAGVGTQSQMSVLIASGFALIAYASLAAALLLYAPAIASWFPDEPAPATPEHAASVRDVYIIAARVLGLYSLIHALTGARRLVQVLLDDHFGSGPAAEFRWEALAEACVYLVAGALLIIFATGIADGFSRAHGMQERPRAERTGPLDGTDD